MRFASALRIISPSDCLEAARPIVKAELGKISRLPDGLARRLEEATRAPRRRRRTCLP
jgi:hypothetical protein